MSDYRPLNTCCGHSGVAVLHKNNILEYKPQTCCFDTHYWFLLLNSPWCVWFLRSFNVLFDLHLTFLQCSLNCKSCIQIRMVHFQSETEKNATKLVLLSSINLLFFWNKNINLFFKSTAYIIYSFAKDNKQKRTSIFKCIPLIRDPVINKFSRRVSRMDWPNQREKHRQWAGPRWLYDWHQTVAATLVI